MKKMFTLLTLLTVVLVGCKYDDGDLWKEIEDHENRLSKLEQQVKDMNAEIAAINGIISALEDNDWITEVSALADGSGYVIHFRNQNSITIKHGKNGSDASAPVIGVKEIAGIYYWTVDGEVMKDGDGNPLPVTAEGDSGVAPKIQINPDTFEWETSTDGGTTWESTGVVAKGQNGTNGTNGTNGNSLFSSVDTTTDPNTVTFYLKAGGSFTVPRLTAPTVTFSDLTDGEFTFEANGAPHTFGYTASANVADLGIVSAIPTGWTVTMSGTDIAVSTSLFGSIKVLIVATTAEGASASYWVTLTSYSLNIQSMIDALAPAGGTVTLQGITYTPTAQITIPANVTVQGVAGTIIRANPAAGTYAVSVAGVLDNVAVEYSEARNPGDAWGAANPGGVNVLAGGTLSNSTVSGFRNGVYANNVANVTITDNTITANRTGIQFGNRVGGTVSGNTITDNETMGFLIQYLSTSADNGTLTIENNTFDGNWSSDFENRWPAAQGAFVVDLSTGNTFTGGTKTVAVAPSSGEGGSGVNISKPASQTANIVTAVASNVTLTGASVSVSPAALAATIATAAPGSEIQLMAATYDAQLSIDKEITLIGTTGTIFSVTAPAAVTLPTASLNGKNPVIAVETGANVTIKNVTITTANTPVNTPVDGITVLGDAILTLDEVTFDGIIATDFSGNQNGRCVTVYGTGSVLTVTNSTFKNFNKNGIHMMAGTANVSDSQFTGQNYESTRVNDLGTVMAAQNGVVFMDGSKGSVTGCNFTNFKYGPTSDSMGVLLYQLTDPSVVVDGGDNTYPNCDKEWNIDPKP